MGHLRKPLSIEAKARWAELLTTATYSGNTTVNRSAGYSPQFSTFGCEARCPSEAIVGLPEDQTLDSVAAEKYRQLSHVLS